MLSNQVKEARKEGQVEKEIGEGKGRHDGERMEGGKKTRNDIND